VVNRSSDTAEAGHRTSGEEQHVRKRHLF